MGKFSCFNEEQQGIFDGLNPKHQRYVVYRGQGYSKADAYELAGYKEKQRGVGGYGLEKSKPEIAELISVLNGSAIHNSIYGEESETSKETDERAMAVPTEISKLSGESARRLQFYRQIANGTIKTIKETRTYDKDGNLTGKKVEETSDISARINARREMDRILGLNDVVNVGQIEANGIKIMIVDATKKEDVDDQRIIGETANE